MNTVADLKRMLEFCPDKAVVVMEGCDCDGNWGGDIDTKYLDDSDHPEIRLTR